MVVAIHLGKREAEPERQGEHGRRAFPCVLIFIAGRFTSPKARNRGRCRTSMRDRLGDPAAPECVPSQESSGKVFAIASRGPLSHTMTSSRLGT
jgi:hypothetical protein